MTTDRVIGALIIVVAFAVSAGAPARADDWPHVRGPRHDGVSAESSLADAWPEGGPPRLWERDLDQGWSGFVAVAGRVYTQRQTLGSQYVLCLDAASGATVWERRYDVAWQPGGVYPGPYATPTVAGNRVYWTSPTGLAGCLDATSGAPLWSIDLVERFGGTGFSFGYAATPLVAGGRVILPAGGPQAGIVALDAGDGHLLWAAGSDPASYCGALPIELAGRELLVVPMKNALAIADAATGEIVHRAPRSSGYDEHAAWPIWREPHLLITGPFRAPAKAVRLEAAARGPLAVTPRWESPRLANDVVSSLLHGEHVFGFDLRTPQSNRHRPSRGTFRCLSWETGEVAWSTDRVGHVAMLAADGKLLMLEDSGALILARASTDAYEELARARLFEGETCWTPPALHEGRLFVRSPSRAVCLWVGRPEDRPPPTATAAAAPAAPGGSPLRWVFSRERAFPTDAPSGAELATWLAASASVLIAAALVAGLIALARRRLLDRPTPAAAIACGLAIALGAAGPGPFSALADRLLFTWPVALFAALHATVLVACWAEERPEIARARWIARATTAGLVALAWGYAALCRTVGMSLGWAFLAGLPTAFPPCVLAARAARRERPARVVLAWTVAAFGVFFATGWLVLAWRTGG